MNEKNVRSHRAVGVAFDAEPVWDSPLLTIRHALALPRGLYTITGCEWVLEIKWQPIELG